MADRVTTGRLVAEIVLLLVPPTFLTAFTVLVAYPTYPFPPKPLQAGFDLAMLVTTAGIVGAWRLVVAYLRGGRIGLRRAHRAWIVLSGAGALIGGAGALVGAEHLLNPSDAEEYVGFALLAPAGLLGPLAIHLARERGRAVPYPVAH